MANLRLRLQAGCNVGSKVNYEEGDEKGDPRRQPQEGLRDYHGTGGSDGFEITE